MLLGFYYIQITKAVNWYLCQTFRYTQASLSAHQVIYVGFLCKNNQQIPDLTKIEVVRLFNAHDVSQLMQNALAYV